MPPFPSQVLYGLRVPVRRGLCLSILSAPSGLLSTQQALDNGISDSKRAHCFHFTNVFSFYSLPPPPPSSSMKLCTLPLRLKWWQATIGTPLPVGRGRDPSPLTPEVVCALKMATPYVTDETGGECGRRGAVSLRALGVGVRTWKRVCAPPIPGPLLCPALRTAFPIHSYGVPPAPPSGLEFRGLCFRSPKPWGPSMLAPTPGPSRPLRFSLAVEAPASLLWVLQPWGFQHLVPSNSYLPFLPLPLFLAVPAFCPTPTTFKFFFWKLCL